MKLKTVLLLIGVPSTTNKGLLLENEASPRIVIFEVEDDNLVFFDVEPVEPVEDIQEGTRDLALV